MSSARASSLEAFRVIAQPGMRVRMVFAVQTGCGAKPMRSNSIGIFLSSSAFWIAAFTPFAKESKISLPWG